MSEDTSIGPVCGLILAGGQARRMGGGDKPLLEIGGQTLLERVIARLAPQVETLALNANGDPARFAAWGLPVVPDAIDGFGGPLVGILSGLDWMRAHAPRCRWLLSAAADTPLLPPDLARRLSLAAAAPDIDLACAASGGRSHPVFGLWPLSLLEDLRQAVTVQSVRAVHAWTARHRLAAVDWPATPFDPFFNVNTPEDAERLRALLAQDKHS